MRCMWRPMRCVWRHDALRVASDALHVASDALHVASDALGKKRVLIYGMLHAFSFSHLHQSVPRVTVRGIVVIASSSSPRPTELYIQRNYLLPWRMVSPLFSLHPKRHPDFLVTVSNPI